MENNLPDHKRRDLFYGIGFLLRANQYNGCSQDYKATEEIFSVLARLTGLKANEAPNNVLRLDRTFHENLLKELEDNQSQPNKQYLAFIKQRMDALWGSSGTQPGVFTELCQ